MSSPNRMTPKGSPNSANPAGIRGNSLATFSSPVYRGALNHGSTAELQEGFRILTKGQKVNLLERQDLLAVMQSAGLHTTDEELQELLRVVHQDERTTDLEFADFLLLMTKEVNESMVEEMRSAFLQLDKNGTGMVTKKQFTEMFVSMGEHSSSEELDELMLLAEINEDSEMVNYNKFVTELAARLNNM